MKLSRELAKQAVITKCRGKINAEPAVSLFKIKPWISVPKKSVIIKISLIFKNLCKSVIICGQKICGKMTQENKSRLIKFLWNLASAVLAAIGTALGVSCAVA